MTGIKFTFTLTTSFQCIHCLKKYQCKKKDQVSNEERKKREREFEETGVLLQCSLCKLFHNRCKNKKCKQCCMLHTCNAIECSNCKKCGIRCEWPFPRTEEEFNKLCEKSGNVLTRSVAKFERS
ncbi:9046_t:CDS:1, partial [Dentiscutata erythropus]